jgi:hypothetical protein
MGFDFVPRSPLRSVQMPANANSGRASSSANRTTSFFFVSGLGSDAYSEKLFAGTRQRLSGFSQPRQCGDDVLRIFVTGAPPSFGGGGIPHRIMVSQIALGAGIEYDGRGVVGKHAGRGREVADVLVHDHETARRRPPGWSLSSKGCTPPHPLAFRGSNFGQFLSDFIAGKSFGRSG